MRWLKGNGIRLRKYKNIPTNGFDSRKEERIFRLLEAAKSAQKPSMRVVLIARQERYELIPSQKGPGGGVIERPVHYTADFVVTYADGSKDVIDVKSPATRTTDYVIRRKLMLFRHGIRVREL